MAGATSDLVRTLGVGQLVLRERQRVTAGEKQWVVQETPQNLQQVALGVPFQVFPVVGKGSRRPCISNLSKKKQPLEKKKSQLVQNGFQKPGYKSENKAQGQKLGDLGLPRGVGTFGFETQLRLWADTG